MVKDMLLVDGNNKSVGINLSTERRMHPRAEASLPIRLEVGSHPSASSSNLIGETIDIGEGGLAMTLRHRLMLPSVVSIYLDSIPSCPHIEAKTEVLWSEPYLATRDKGFRYGLRFLNVDIGSLKKFIGEINRKQVGDYLGAVIPDDTKEKIKENYIFEKFDQKQIMKVIDFKPPFLKIEKMVVLAPDGQDLICRWSVGTGILTVDDTKGHYNDTIFLAQCGWLMGSAASIFLAILFPSTSPQVVEVDRIRPSTDRTLWKPSPNGSRFFIETRILKKRLQVVIVNVKITFGDIFMGEVERLKLVLTPKDSIWEAKELMGSK